MSQPSPQVLETGKIYTFEIELRRQPPPTYTGPIHRVRAWIDPNIPAKLAVDAPRCQVVGEPEIIDDPRQNAPAFLNRIRWRFQLRPLERGRTTVFLTCTTADGAPFAETQFNLSIDGNPYVPPPPAPARTPPPQPQPRRVVIDVRTYPRPNAAQLGALRNKIGGLMYLLTELECAGPIPDVGEVGQKVMALARGWFWGATLADLPAESPIVLIDSDHGLPFELGHAEGGLVMGFEYPIGHTFPDVDRPPKSAPAMLKVLPIGEMGFALAAGRFQVVSAKLTTISPHPNKFMILADAARIAQSHVIHLSAETARDGLMFSLNGAGPFTWNPLQELKASPPRLGGVFLVVVAPSGPEPFAAPVVAKRLMDQGAQAVVTSVIPLPPAIHAAFAAHFYPLVAGGQPLGEALRKARKHLWQAHHNPAGALYALFGDPELTLQ